MNVNDRSVYMVKRMIHRSTDSWGFSKIYPIKNLTECEKSQMEYVVQIIDFGESDLLEVGTVKDVVDLAITVGQIVADAFESKPYHKTMEQQFSPENLQPLKDALLKDPLLLIQLEVIEKTIKLFRKEFEPALRHEKRKILDFRRTLDAFLKKLEVDIQLTMKIEDADSKESSPMEDSTDFSGFDEWVSSEFDKEELMQVETKSPATTTESPLSPFTFNSVDLGRSSSWDLNCFENGKLKLPNFDISITTKVKKQARKNHTDILMTLGSGDCREESPIAERLKRDQGK